MYCKYCGAQNPEGAKFCGECGTEIVEMSAPLFVPAVEQKESLTCKKCGKVNKHSARFCSNCGNDFSVKASSDEITTLQTSGVKMDKTKRTLLAVLLIAALVLCLFTVACYALGFRSVYYTESTDDSFDMVYFTNIYALENTLEDMSAKGYDMDTQLNGNQEEVYRIVEQSISNQWFSLTIYLVLASILIVVFVLFLNKPNNTECLTIVAAVTGIAILILDFLCSYYQIQYDVQLWSVVGSYRNLPHLITLPMFALFAIMLFTAAVFLFEKKSNIKDRYVEGYNRSGGIKLLLCSMLILSVILCIVVAGKYLNGSVLKIYTYGGLHLEESGIHNIFDYPESDIRLWKEHNTIVFSNINQFRSNWHGEYNLKYYTIVVAAAYCMLACFMSASVVLLLRKSPKGRMYCVISGILCITVIVMEYFVGCEMLKVSEYHMHWLAQYCGIVPHLLVLIMLPFAVLIPMLSFMLPRKQRKPGNEENVQNNRLK